MLSLSDRTHVRGLVGLRRDGQRPPGEVMAMARQAVRYFGPLYRETAVAVLAVGLVQAELGIDFADLPRPEREAYARLADALAATVATGEVLTDGD